MKKLFLMLVISLFTSINLFSQTTEKEFTLFSNLTNVSNFNDLKIKNYITKLVYIDTVKTSTMGQNFECHYIYKISRYNKTIAGYIDLISDYISDGYNKSFVFPHPKSIDSVSMKFYKNIFNNKEEIIYLHKLVKW